MEKRKTIASLAVLVVAALLVGYFYYFAEKRVEISSFDECVEAGYAIMKSLPEQCATPDGKVFVREYEVTESGDFNTYTDPSGSVRFSYPSFARVSPVPTGYTQTWKVGAVSASGALIADVRIPKSYMEGTNFSDARFTIGRSAEANEIKGCTAVQDNFDERKEVEIEGYPFYKMAFSEAAAGNRYDTTSYRGIFDGDCYVIEYTIHSTNIGNYPAELGVKEFDRAEATEMLEDMVESVEFLISSD